MGNSTPIKLNLSHECMPAPRAIHGHDNPPVKECQSEVEFSRNLYRGGSLEEIVIYRKPDPGRS